MDTKLLGDRLQFVATIGVIVGLGLVIWELRQQREFAMAEMSSQSHFLALEHSGTRFGDQAMAPLLVKACRKPQDLGDEEIALLIFYAQDRFLLAQRLFVLERRSDLYGEQWRGAVRTAAGELFSVPYLRALWGAGLIPQQIPAMRDEIDRLLAERGDQLPSCGAILDDAKSAAEALGRRS